MLETVKFAQPKKQAKQPAEKLRSGIFILSLESI